ncbi:hypothetical protein ACA910_008752 [Epithemia clementina (nom. ined.)]
MSCGWMTKIPCAFAWTTSTATTKSRHAAARLPREPRTRTLWNTVGNDIDDDVDDQSRILHSSEVTTRAIQPPAAHPRRPIPQSPYTAPISSCCQRTEQQTKRRQVLFQGASGLLATILATTTTGWMTTGTAAFADDSSTSTPTSSSFADISARANQISLKMDQEALAQNTGTIRATTQTAYDFTLPVQGEAVKFADLIGQEFYPDGNVKVKAILVVNMKQDDPVARKTIPELMALATKYGRSSGAVAVVASPTDQGYYEPDTSALIRLKLASEYGYGLNPATVVTDKVNLLGTGAHPFWRWLQSTSRIPTSGVGRIQGNFEKWLIDGKTGLPVRRYPRRFPPLDLAEDLQAVLDGKGSGSAPSQQMPPPKGNYMEAWRSAVLEAERDTYRFEKGLNVFDQ